MNSFAELNLSLPLAKAIAEMGYTTPTPIQAKTLPILSAGKTDFLGMAATGTGKTAAFGIPLLERIDASIRATQAIVLCPTRELALQVSLQLTQLGKHKKIAAQAIYGGAGYGDQLRSLKRGAPVLVATPGRLIDHLKQGNLQLDAVTTVVMDEADEMISMGFKEDLEFLLSHLPEGKCNTWLFAATMSPELRRVADKYLNEPQLAQVNRTDMLSGTVKQVFYTVREKNKPRGLMKLIDMADDFYGLIFCQTKALVTELTDHMRARGYHVDCLHGDKTQAEREKTLALFRERKTTILVCSDVAARGLDVKELTHVINYSLPMELDSYVHRIGRTGRSGSVGLALNLVSPAQMNLIGRIERVTKSKMEAGIFPTRKDISQKKMAQLLPKYMSVSGYGKAIEVLDESWAKTFESMSKSEIAARFLALSFPDLFDDREMPDDIGLGDRDREERPNRPQSGRRPFFKNRRFGNGPQRPWGGRGKPFHKRDRDTQ